MSTKPTIIYTKTDEAPALATYSFLPIIRAFASTSGVDVERPPASGTAVLSDLEVYVPLEGLIDLDVERQRQQKELDKLEKLLGGLEKKLQNEKFLANAPSDVVESEKRKQAEYETTASKLKETLALLA